MDLQQLPLTPSSAPLAAELKIIFRAMVDEPKEYDWYAEQLAQAVDNHLRRGLDGLGSSMTNSQQNAFAEHIRIYHADDDNTESAG